ncbi:hypothetical protein F8388_002139 [Cannabis sativa]|uniref:RNase H type-1 domain-containing protein n=1 Tax=Cannabis sativa TaxID=3483 RepID=A0A7J6H5R7_CANSA|nr:hypothetical protein F8388_002139 [Cannabis sativa]KAF4389870.1 hypothetical protein G4B88_024151 [Cannabis sativa]
MNQTLPGIGEICPIEDTANLVVKKLPANLPIPASTAVEPENDSSSGVPSVTVQAADKGEGQEPGSDAVIQNDTSYNGQFISSSAQDQPGKNASKGNGTPNLSKESNEKDSKSMEFESGPKKRKALDGILIGPSPLKYNDQESTMGDSNLSPLTSNQSSKDIKDPSPVIAVESGFSPGSVEDAKIKRKRGRPVSIRTEKSANEEEGQVSTQRRRGRPAKANPTVGVKPNVFKRNQKRSATKQQQTIKAHWDNEMFDLTVDLDNHFVLNKVIGIISSDPPERPWIIMGIYGPPSFGEKEEFWKKVGEYIDHCNFPLLLMGDLNGTLKDGENLNYANASNTTRYSFDLRRMVHRTGLVDLGYTGVKFTWFKKSMDPSVGSSLKRARLDRAMASTDWRVDWPNAIVSHLTATSSDHNPILLDTLGGKFCTKPQFKYEMMWERDPRVFWVVKRAWIEKGHQHPMVNLYRKIKHTKDHLTKWNKEQFKKLSVQINEARVTLKWKPKNEKRGHLRTSEAGWWNCCTDVSIQHNQSFGAAVFRDEQDRVVAIFAERLSATNPLLAEATILTNAAEFAREHLKGKVAFQCDNEVVVANCSITCNTNQFIDIVGAINQFKNTVRLLDDFKISKIDRTYNFLAHNSAKWAAAVGATGVLDLGVMDEKVFSDVQEWNPD